MTWRDLESDAPEIARLGKERFERVGVALLGTLRRDGSPRISPVEPFVAAGELVFGAMAWSGKAHDLLRDPRCVVHSAVCDPDNPDGELKLYGRASEAAAETRDAAVGAWWIGRPVADARVFTFAVERAEFITWNPLQGLLTLRRWSPADGFATVERRYP